MTDRRLSGSPREGTKRRPSPGRSTGGRKNRSSHDGYSRSEPTRIEDIPQARRMDIEKVVLNVYNEVVYNQPPPDPWFEKHMTQQFPLRNAEVRYAYKKVEQYFPDRYANLDTRDKIEDKIVDRYHK